MKPLTPKQSEAVESIFGPIMVIAGPGTGKTQVLSARIANILKKTDTPPWSILALTFTESGVKAMRERLVRFIGSDAYYVEIHTFHSFALKIINEFDEKFIKTAEYSLASELEKIEMIREILTNNKYSALKVIDDPFFYVRRIEKAISVMKRENVTPEKLIQLAEMEKEKAMRDSKVYYKKTGEPKKTEVTRINNIYAKQIELSDIFEKYQIKMHEKKKRDFDDIIIEVIEKLRNDEDLRLTLQERYLFLLVDEYQDTNSSQNEIISALINEVEQPNIFIVGDDDQSIYRFQGASVSNILNFENNLQQTQKIVLTDNFRSTQMILNAAMSLIENNNNRLTNLFKGLSKKFKANVNFPEEPIDVLKFADNKLEAFYIAKKINELIQNGATKSEIAVIARKNADLNDIVEELTVMGIPYTVSRDNNVLDDPEIRKLITILRLVNDPDNDTLFFAAMNFDFFNVPLIDVLETRRQATLESKTIFQYLLSKEGTGSIFTFTEKLSKWIRNEKNLPFIVFFSELLKETGFIDFLINHPLKIEKINRLSSLFDEVKVKNFENKDFKLKDFLNYIDLLYEYGISVKENAITSDIDSIQLMTAHSSKGLEFDSVFLIKCTDKNWGNNNRSNDIKLPDEIIENSKIDDKEKNEDERRLFYVGITRAKKKVFISYPEKISNNGISNEVNPSMFITEIPEELKHYADTSVYEGELLDHVIQKIEYVPKADENEEKRYISKLVENFTLNATALNVYLECSEKFKLNNLYRLPGAKTARLSFGTAMHKAFENFYNKIKEGKVPPVDSLVQLFEIALDNEVLGEHDKEELLKKGRESIKGYYEKYKDTFRAPLLTEMNFAKRGIYFDGVQLTGKLDRVDVVDEKKKLVKVVDYKTGRTKSRNEIEGKTKKADRKYKNQLLFYKLLIDSDKNFGYKAISGELDFVEGKNGRYEKIDFEYNEDELNDFKKILGDVIKKIKAQEFQKTTDKSICATCDFYKICWGG